MPIYKIKAGYDEATQTTTERDSWVVSSGGTWLPGSYASEAAAKLARRCTAEQLSTLEMTVNQVQQREITVADIEAILLVNCPSNE